MLPLLGSLSSCMCPGDRRVHVLMLWTWLYIQLGPWGSLVYPVIWLGPQDSPVCLVALLDSQGSPVCPVVLLGPGVALATGSSCSQTRVILFA